MEELKTPPSPATPSPPPTFQFQQAKSAFLSAVNHAFQDETPSQNDEPLIQAWNALCQHFLTHTDLETDWVDLLEQLHAACFHWLVDDNPRSALPENLESKTEPETGLQAACSAVLPAVKPMQWQIVLCPDQASAEAQLQKVTEHSPQERVICGIWYWKVGEEIHFRYGQSGQQPVSGVLSTLQISAEPVEPNFIIENILAMPALQDVLRRHHQLKLNILRRFLYLIPSPKAWDLLKTNTSSALEVIYQQRAHGPVYYARWFIPPTSTSEPSPLPGQWHVAYPPSSVSVPVENSEGWIQLDQHLHAPLLHPIQHQITQHLHRERLAQCCRLYTKWQETVTTQLSVWAQMTWHQTLAEAIIQDNTSFAFASALKEGAKALELAEQVAPASDTFTRIEQVVDQCIQSALHQTLLPLWQNYRQPWADALQPLENLTGRVPLATYEMLYQTWEKSLPFLLWLNPHQALQEYETYHQTWFDHLPNIKAQIEVLIKIKNPTPEQTRTLEQWKSLVNKLYVRWQEDGYLELAQKWQHALAAIIPIIPAPIEEVLASLQEGLATLKLAQKPITLPTAWEKANESMRALLARYAAYGQISAYTQIQRQYLARLQSYQSLCEALSHQEPEYEKLAHWCREQVEAIQTVTPEVARQFHTLNPPYAWQRWREEGKKGMTGTRLQTLTTQLREWLPTPPCSFEILAVESTAGSKNIHLYLLISDAQLAQHSYFTAYIHLLRYYYSLINQSRTTPTLNIQIGLPKELAGQYCSQTIPNENTPSVVARNTRFLFHESVGNLATGESSLLSRFATTLSQNLKQAAAETHAQETIIRQKYHALPTQTLLEEKTSGEANQKSPQQMLERRMEAQRQIEALWQKEQIQAQPIIDLLAELVIQKPGIVEEALPQGFLPPSQSEEHPAASSDREKDEKGEEKREEQAEKEEKAEDLIPLAEPEKPSPVLRIYRNLPRFAKARFIQQLEKRGLDRTILTRLYHDADPSGWCYEQERITEVWQKTLCSLCEDVSAASNAPNKPPETKKEKEAPPKPPQEPTYPKVTISFVVGRQVVQHILRIEIVKQLLDEKGQWRQKAKGVSGRHQVLRVVIPRSIGQPPQAVWFKLNPEQPSTEYIVQQIDQRLGCFATPPQQLVKIQVGNQASIPVLISQEAAKPNPDPKQSANLADVLKHRPEILQNLSPLSFVSTLLRVLIVHPEDDKSNDYFLVPDPDLPGHFRLLRIDNERAFFSPDQPESGFFSGRELNVKTIIFCLDQMLVSWEELTQEDTRLTQYQHHIQQLVPAELFQDLLRDASDLHDQWCQLFSEQEVVQIIGAGLTQKECILPVMLIFPDCEKALLERLYLIQQAWQQGSMQGLSLLESVQPGLANHYKSLLSNYTTAVARFEAGPGKWYKRDHNQQHRTTLESLPALSRQLNLAVILKLNTDPKRQAVLIKDLIQRVWRREQYSVTQSLYGVGVWQQTIILNIEQNLQVVAGVAVKNSQSTLMNNPPLSVRTATPNPTAAKPSPPGHHWATAEEAAELRRTAQLQFQLLPMSDRTALFKRVSQQWAANRANQNSTSHHLVGLALLETLTQTPLDHLVLTPFQELLTDKLLKPILVCAGRQLLKLDISECRLLTEGALQIIEKYCLNVRYLKAQKLSWRKIKMDSSANASLMPLKGVVENVYWQHLIELDFSQSEQLQKLLLLDLPHLKRLKLRQLPVLQKIELWYLAHLEQLDLKQLNQLERVRLYKLPNLTQLDLKHSKQLQYVYLQDLLNLATLNLQGCSALRELADKTRLGAFSALILQPCSLPKLTRLNISQCIALEELQLIGFNTETLECASEGVPPDLLAKWVECLYQTQGIDPRFFVQLNHALQDAKGIFDLSTVKANDSLLSALIFVLKFNLPIKHLVLPKVQTLSSAKISSKLENEYDFIFRIALLGHIDAGKSSLLLRFTEGNFTSSYISTIGVDFKMKTIDIDQYKIKLQIWDIYNESRARFRVIDDDRDWMADIYLICAAPQDGDNEYYMRETKDFYDAVGRNARENTRSILIATKMDDVGSLSEEKFESYCLKLRAFANEHELPYFECSAKTGKGVEELFLATARLLLYDDKNIELRTQLTISKGLYYNYHLLSIEYPEGALSSPSVEISQLLARNRKLAGIDGEEKGSEQALLSSELKLTPPELAQAVPTSVEAKAVESSTSPAILGQLTLPPEQEEGFEEESQSWENPPETKTNSELLPDLSIHLPTDPPETKHIEPDQSTPARQHHLHLNYQDQSSTHQKKEAPPALSPAQAYIQVHPPLQQYHDLLLQILELQIKATLLGTTGRLTATNIKVTGLGVASGAVDMIPVIGGPLAAPVIAAKVAAQAAMMRDSAKIAQLFTTDRDVETKIAQLAEQMTLSISEELLFNKPTSSRRAAQETGGLKRRYEHLRNTLSKKQAEYITWQSLTPIQHKARMDAEYLMEQLPGLVTSPTYRGSQTTVETYLRILMHDPAYQYDEAAILARASNLTEQKTFPSRVKPPSLTSAQHFRHLTECQNCLSQLTAQAEQPLTAESWPAIERTVEALEVTLLKLAPWHEQASAMHEQKPIDRPQHPLTHLPGPRVMPGKVAGNSAAFFQSPATIKKTSPVQHTQSTVTTTASSSSSSSSPPSTTYGATPDPDIPESVIEESKRFAQGKIGPLKIKHWVLQNVETRGNCFYEAVVLQLQQINHAFFAEVPEGTLPRDALRLRIQGRLFKDEEWADQAEIIKLARQFNFIVAIVDTRSPTQHFMYHYIAPNGEYTYTNNRAVLPTGRSIVQLAFTGNHYLSVTHAPEKSQAATVDEAKKGGNEETPASIVPPPLEQTAAQNNPAAETNTLSEEVVQNTL